MVARILRRKKVTTQKPSWNKGGGRRGISSRGSGGCKGTELGEWVLHSMVLKLFGMIGQRVSGNEGRIGQNHGCLSIHYNTIKTFLVATQKAGWIWGHGKDERKSSRGVDRSHITE